MKKLLFVLSIFISIGCNYKKERSLERRQSSPTNVGQPREYGYSIDYEPFLSSESRMDSIQVVFESSFKDDSVKIFVGDEMKLNKRISTDQSIGLAFVCNIIKDDKKLIEIVVNRSTPIKIPNYSKYDFLRISVINNNVNVILSNQKSFYK